MTTLSEKKKMYVDKYLECGNKQLAYAYVWPKTSVKSLKVKPYVLMKEPEVHEYLIQRQEELSNNTMFNATFTLSKLGEIATSSKTTIKDKLKAIDLIQKQLGLQQQKVDTTMDLTGISFKVDYGDGENGDNQD